MKKLFSMILAMVMCVSLTACGGGVDKQPAIDAFNSANTAFTELANKVNADIEAYPDDLIDVMTDMSGMLSEYKALLEGDQELTEENITEIIGVFNQVETWAKESLPQLDSLIAVDKQPAIDAFNKANTAFTALAEKINANPAAYSEEKIAEMNQMAEILATAKAGLESDKELTEEAVAELVNTMAEVEAWVASKDFEDVELVESDELLLSDVIDYYNTLIERFDTIAYMVDEDPSAFDDEFVADMVTVSEGLAVYGEALSSGEEATQEDLELIVTDLTDFDMWLQEVESQFLG